MNKEDYKIAYENVMIANKMLEQEIKELNDNIIWWNNRFKAVERDYENLKERFENLVQEHIDTINRNEEKQQKIDKAIEYIKNASYFDGSSMCANDLLEILGDKE